MRATMRYVLIIIPVLFLAFVTGCGDAGKTPSAPSASFEVTGFVPLANWTPDSAGGDGNPAIYLDYTEAREKGFFIPTIRQTEDGFFHFSFSVKNNGNAPSAFAYKIYYQNESYKFPERDTADSSKMHPYCGENFYGSWEEVDRTFEQTGEVQAGGGVQTVTGRFRIAGNPRNEQRYYSKEVNDRWKRNPRVGEYSFMLVVTAPVNVQTIPEYIRNIGKTNNGAFVSPYFYFLCGEGATLGNTVVTVAPQRLRVIARPDPGAGIYISPLHYNQEQHGKYFTAGCGQDSNLYRTAQFDQFVHYIDPTTKYSNIPVVMDVLNDNYSLADYNWNKQFYRQDELVSVTAATAAIPCQTVYSDPREHKITMMNPGTEFGKWEKQNVGVITRHGFTYGKWTVKAKLTELVNRNGLWNGLTNAVWLITMDQNEWNWRRDCSNGGYMESYYGGPNDKRVKNVGYSEIDFEILKTVPYCPNYVLPPAYNHGLHDQYDLGNWNIPLPGEVDGTDGMVQVACTNWDMACWDPADFSGGCNPVVLGDQVFWAHRWDRNYRAITTKVPAPDDELFAGPYFYFQIDWQPERIIWRIGPEKDQLRAVGYVDSRVTSIPNNQMLLIISQEFHNTRWWVGSMYSQDNIPFPKNDIIGEIYEVTIE